MEKKIKLHVKIIYGIWIAVIFASLFFLRMYTLDRYFLWKSLLSINFAYLCTKLVLSLLYRDQPRHRLPDRGSLNESHHRISVVLPHYNESIESLIQALDSLLSQTRLVDQIIFIDDGSPDRQVHEALVQKKEELDRQNLGLEIIVLRQEENQGKKKVQEIAFQRVTGDIIMLLDSDGVISPNTVEDMIRAFNDKKIGCVVGRITPRNPNVNLLTRMQDIIYSNSFQMGRRAQSKLGTVLVCSGALSMYRADLIKKNMDIFRKEKFLGIPCITGDDRLLTMIVMKEGYQSVYQDTAICKTDVPTKLKKYFRQQVRWNKSAFLMTIYSFRYFYKRPHSLLFGILESYLWLFNLIILLYVWFTIGITVTPLMVIIAVIYNFLVYYLSCIYYANVNIFRYILGFLYGFFYGLLLIVMRVYALITLPISRWATR